MKDTHDMTRLELEIEVTELRLQVKNLIQDLDRKNKTIEIYGTYIDNMNSKKKVLKKNKEG